MKKFLTSLALALLAVFSVLPCAYAEEYVPLGSYAAGEKLNCYISNVDAGAQVVSLDLPRGCSLVDDFNGGTRRLLLGGAPTEAGQHAFSIQVSGVENYTINCSIDLTPALPSIQTCQDVTCAPGSSVLLSVSAWTTDGGSLSYQWYTGVGFTSIPIDGATDPVKSLLSWRLFSQFGTTGIFICFTGESCVNPDTYEAWIPFTMCHEIAHRQAVAAEDEANFCAYLACMENPKNDFRYSGAMAAYIYCNNALAKVDRSAASAIWQNVADGVRADAQAANAHYAQYEGKVQDAAQKVNDAYLKAFNEESGVQSYGEVADLLIAWYLQKTA